MPNHSERTKKIQELETDRYYLKEQVTDLQDYIQDTHRLSDEQVAQIRLKLRQVEAENSRLRVENAELLHRNASMVQRVKEVKDRLIGWYEHG